MIDLAQFTVTTLAPGDAEICRWYAAHGGEKSSPDDGKKLHGIRHSDDQRTAKCKCGAILTMKAEA